MPAPIRPITALVVGLAVVGTGLIGYQLFGPKAPSDQAYRQGGQTLSQFDMQVAKMAADELGNIPGLGIRPTDAELPIGTLFIPGHSLELDEDSCRANPPPEAYRAHAFPDFNVQDAVAASVGLDPSVTQQLVALGANIDRHSSISIRFDALERQYLDDHKLAELLRRPACIAALADGPVSMIRGYFRGQRNFVLATTGTGKIDAKLAKIANFEVDRGAGESSVTLKDPSDFGFLQIYTQVALKTTTSTTTTTTTVAAPNPVLLPPPPPPPDEGAPQVNYKYYWPSPSTASVSIPVKVSTVTTRTASVITAPAASLAVPYHVYIQRDALDGSHRDAIVATDLSQAGFPVASKVESVPSGKMPNQAQVRYFNLTDLESAKRALVILQKQFPNAQLRRIPLPSPNGQLEVWLPKVSS